MGVTAKSAADGELLAVLGRTLAAMNEATARDTLIALASRAATSLADADGVCLISARQDRCVYTAAKDPRPNAMRLAGSALLPLTAGIDAVPQLRVPSGDVALRLPDGYLQRIVTLLLLPLAPGSGWNTLGVFWSQPHHPSLMETQTLSMLGSALNLALQVQSKDLELARSHQRQKRLLADLQHRVRNMLAFVRSIIRRTGETAESAEEFALHLEARISALARTQGTLALAGTSGVELEDLVRAEMTASAVREDRLHITGPPIRLHAKGAETIAMALHELATNSLKFGALAAPQGRISVQWQTDWTVSPPRLRVSWIESGVKIAVLAPRRRGFGQELIEQTLPYQLNAETRFSFMPGGLECRIDVPLTQRTTNSLEANDAHATNDTAG